MKYFSDVTTKLYDTEDALKEAEAEYAKEQAAEAEKKQVRSSRAKEVEEAYKAVLAAQQHYNELKNKFIEDYGSFHMSFTQKTPNVDALWDLLFDL